MINKIITGDYVFTSEMGADGILMEGSFFLGNSLSYDELTVDTLDFSIRYFGNDTLTNYVYGKPVYYYKDDELVGKFYLDRVVQTGSQSYYYSCVSAIGLLEDTFHYGGVYQSKRASDLIDEIIAGKIEYSVNPIFEEINLYGWLPIGSRRDNLKQVLFACGGSVRKDEDGNSFITVLETVAPIMVDDNCLTDGRITFDKKATEINVTEHSFTALEQTELEDIFDGELVGSSFTTPMGYKVTNASLLKFENPYHSVTVDGTNVLNDEVNPNYCVVAASSNVKVQGKPYIHAKSIVTQVNNNIPAGNGEKVVKVEDATLVSLANVFAVSERVMAYSGNHNTVEQGIYLDNETTADSVQFTNPWGKTVRGYISEMDGEMGSEELYADCKIITDYTPRTIRPMKPLQSIAITTMPRTVYEAGTEFDTTGMVVTATYEGGSTAEVINYYYTPMRDLTMEDTEVTIYYRELGVTCSAVIPIQVKLILKSIAVTSPPYTLDYYIGDVFDTTGMVVTAYYSAGTSHVVTNYTYSPSGALADADTEVTITYTEDGITKNAYVDINVGEVPDIVSIEITNPPDKVKYKVGEYFDTTGLELTAYYADGKSRIVRGYTYSPSGVLTANNDVITVSYVHKGVTKTDTVNIEVVYLSSIAITTPPQKTSYYEDETFDRFGMVVTATYSDGSTEVLDENAYLVTPVTLKDSDTQVTISYTEQGYVKTAIQEVEVTYYPYEYTSSIVLPESGTYTLADIGATHRNIRIVTIGGGDGGQGGQNGADGGAGTSAWMNAGQSGTVTGQSGTGGEGGESGTFGAGAKFSSQDVLLDAADDVITITVGAGGTGGANGADGAIGANGEATTAAVNGVTITSATGSTSGTGYTDTLTQLTYALAGIGGKAGANGGNGGNANDNGTVGEDAGSATGGNFGGYDVNRYTREKTVTDAEATKLSETWSGWSNIGPTYTARFTGGYTWKLTGDNLNLEIVGSKTIGYKHDSGGVRYYNEGSIFIDVSNGSFYYNRDITHTLKEKHCDDKGFLTQRTLTVKTRRNQYEYEMEVAAAKCSSGGGGAAYEGVNGGDSPKGAGGVGASATAPATVTTYGNGGNGGNGGGGGGGGGCGAVITSGDCSQVNVSSYSAGSAGGAGGAGSAGSNGAQGCVIIYYS